MLTKNHQLILGFLLGVALLCSLVTLFSYHATNCVQSQQQAHTQAPSNEQAPASDEPDTEKSKHTKHPPFVCSVVGIPFALVSMMDGHEGFFMGTFTFMLVVVTAWLVRATLQLWAAGERQVSVAEKSAEAALLQAKAMIAAESAVFAVSSLKLVGYKDEKASIALEGLDPAPPGVPPPFCRILIGLQNRGRTEMTINRIFCDWVIDATVDERPEHHFEEIWNGALPRENSIWSASQNGLRLDNLAAEHIGNFGRFLWVYGKIIYTDFMGDQFEHGFIARWTTSEGFVRDPLANYEYKRKI